MNCVDFFLVSYSECIEKHKKEAPIVVNSDSNLTLINLDVWSKRELVTNIKLTSSNNNNNKPIYNIGIKCKAQNHKQNIKKEEKQTYQKMFT